MKKSTFKLMLLMFFVCNFMFATKYTIVTSGFTYSPATVNATVGDTISIAATSLHPLVMVSQADWNTNTPTPVSGWTNKTSTYTFVITVAADIYYGCANHMSTSGMKGMISVASAGITSANVNYGIGLFPNPVTNGEFTVKAEGFNGNNGKILIYSEEGKLMEAHSLNGVSTQVKMRLSAGIYYYDVMINNQKATRGKFVNNIGK
ncbi:MAG: T9SS type A sorting domain-containing protein [Bacteroidia bacterium]